MLLHIIAIADKACSGTILYNSDEHVVLVIIYLVVFAIVLC